MNNPSYHARNLVVASSYNIGAKLQKTFERMRKRKDCPVWLLASLQECIRRNNEITSELIRHRDNCDGAL